MKRIFVVFAAALAVSLALAQQVEVEIDGETFTLNFDAMETDPGLDYSGFDSFGWNSSRNYVLSENETDGYTPSDNSPDWLWYDGLLSGCPTQTGYRFVSQRLTSGLVYFHTGASRCTGVMVDWLEMSYEVELEEATLEGWVTGTEIFGEQRENYWILRFHQASQ